MLEVIGLCIDREIPAATRNRKFQISGLGIWEFPKIGNPNTVA